MFFQVFRFADYFTSKDFDETSLLKENEKANSKRVPDRRCSRKYLNIPVAKEQIFQLLLLVQNFALYHRQND